MDQSKQGVAPRTCLSKLPLKPRPVGPPSNGRSMGPPVKGRPMGPPSAQGRRNFSGPPTSGSPAPRSMVPAPLSPVMNGRVSPATGSPQLRQGPRQRARTVSNPAAGPQLQPQAMSPIPASPKPMVVDTRPRSNSMDQAADEKPIAPAALTPLMMFTPAPGGNTEPASPSVGSSVPARKPVPGQAL